MKKWGIIMVMASLLIFGSLASVSVFAASTSKLMVSLPWMEGIIPQMTKKVSNISIFYMVKASQGLYWRQVKAGAMLALKQFGIKNYTFEEPAMETEVTKQIAILEEAITEHPDAIVLAPTVADSLVPGTIKAMKEGIKMIVIDSNENTDDYVSFIASNNFGGGELAADWMAKYIKEKYGSVSGEVAVIDSSAGVGSLDARLAGFKKELAKYPGLKIVAVRYASGSVAKAMNEAINLFTAYPNLKGIFANNEYTADGLIRAIQLKHMQGKMVYIGFDSDPTISSAIKNGTLNAALVQNPWYMGYLSVVYAVDAVENVPVPHHVVLPLVPITKENINTGVGKAISAPISFHQNW